MTSIVEVFDHPGRRLTHEDVALRTGLPRTTTYRILCQLVALGWLERSSTEYHLGHRAYALGDRWAWHTNLRAIALPHLHELASHTGLVAHLAILDRTEVYFLDCSGGDFANVSHSMIGRRLTAHCTAVGKAMLAQLAPETLDDVYAAAAIRRTDSPAAALNSLHGELAQVRVNHGLAIERGNHGSELACLGIALPAFSAAAGVSVAGTNHRLVVGRLAPILSATARNISNEAHEQHSRFAITPQTMSATRQA
ncbi:IclR family transcriptional regulator [Mycolicibacterium vinylchloridicum]|uniref:IclR family transcriptional regulator n=1 Tax=Mycolicibacterium vinylchloridicum TaxID=2736928 RepID=UPI0015CD3C0E|nr:IclR family transcriptional regulator [Mycolicibacterium vinylchloridicum]